MKSRNFLAISALLVGVPIYGQIPVEPPPLNIGVVASKTPVTLEINMGGYSANVIVTSSDLTSWIPYLIVTSKIQSFQLVDLDTIDPPQTHRFYRLAQLGVAGPLYQRNHWIELGFTNYQFRFTRRCFCTPKVLSGTVTVKDGKVVSVTDAVGDGLPIPTPDLSQFKSVEDLFDLVQSDQYKADVFAVAFDGTLYYPRLIEIDYNAPIADDEVDYQVSDVHSLN